MKRKIVCITGAYGGLGQEFAKAFGNDGWDVIVTGRNERKLQKLKWDKFKLDVKSDENIHALKEYLNGKYKSEDDRESGTDSPTSEE